MPDTAIKFLRRDVDLTNAQTNAPLIPPANAITSFWVAAMPAGLTASLKFGNKQDIPLANGLNITWDCEEENEGVFLTTTPALPGQTLTIIFGISPFKVGG